MKAFAETVAALGRPLLVRKIGPRVSPQALIARWKHGDARVETNAADALRVCLSLRGGHTVRLGRGSLPAKTIESGSVTVFAPDRYSDVQIEGEADVVQIFIDSAHLNEEVGSRVAYKSSFDLHDAELQAAALRLFVSARGGSPDDDLLMETILWSIIEFLVARLAPDRPTRQRGGMACGAMRRVEELIADRLDAEDIRAPTIDDLARAAGMSVSHFIRAFRRSTGATPHQHVLARRIERAMGLLARPECSVAEVADSTGYASPSHFVASFRQRMGVTPGTYRDAVLT
jgi:AraC family transcriptional regulator